MNDEFIQLTDIADGHAVYVKFTAMRTVEAMTSPFDHPYTAITMCGSNEPTAHVMESPDRIFELINERVIVGLNGDHGLQITAPL